MKRFLLLGFLAILLTPTLSHSKTSIANEWNEELLFAIRHSRARPTVHARNLYHWSAAAYDAWAAYEPSAKPYLLGDTLEGYTIPFRGVPDPDDRLKAQRKAISYASYRLMKHRYQVSPNYAIIQQELNKQMRSLGYPISDTATSYWDGEPAHLGNYIAEQIIAYGLQDGAHEASNYKNQQYKPLNDTLNLTNNGTPGLRRPNHWQPLQITQRVDQAGNPIKATQSALSPEWGDVDPFALADSNYVTKTRDRNGNDYKVWLDPGPPPYLDTANPSGIKSEYKWNFCMVSIWQSHLDPADTTTWNISPGNIGNLQSYPDQFSRYDSFYNFKSGGGPGLGKGYDVNPATGKPYQPQRVKRADYARILAEYWADGKSSETPPGHWFAIYNEVEEDPAFKRQWKGRTSLSDLAYDLRTYLSLGGAMHDAAVSAWSVKGWYDYVRPVSAIRNMAKQGQCTDPNKRNFDSAGIPLIKDYIELVEPGDPLAGNNGQHVGEIKLYTWRGPDHVQNTETDTAGAGWILAGNWWPYQKPSFVTPPFPGYVSGHSTFSQAAARILTQSTGSPYFPGGKSDFHFEKNEYLEHENGPTEDVTLTYATYKDAADWTALSRIWGGIHPPADDINGRKIGRKVGNYAFQQADSLFSIQPPVLDSLSVSDSLISRADIRDTLVLTLHFGQAMQQGSRVPLSFLKANPAQAALKQLQAGWTSSRTYELAYRIEPSQVRLVPLHCQVKPTTTMQGGRTQPFLARNPFVINTQQPAVTALSASDTLITDSLAGQQFHLEARFAEPMDTTVMPAFRMPTGSTLQPDSSQSTWQDKQTYRMSYHINDQQVTRQEVRVNLSGAYDEGGNPLKAYDTAGLFSIAMSNPSIVSHELKQATLNSDDQGATPLVYKLVFDQPMDTELLPRLRFSSSEPVPVVVNNRLTQWLNDSTCRVAYRLQEQKAQLSGVRARLEQCRSALGNPAPRDPLPGKLLIDTKKPTVDSVTAKASTVARRHQQGAPYTLTVHYAEPMNIAEKPVAFLAHEQSLEGIISYDIFASSWADSHRFKARFRVRDSSTRREDIDLRLNFGEDRAGNNQVVAEREDQLSLDTEKPEIAALTATHYELRKSDQYLTMFAVYNKVMDTSIAPVFRFRPDSTIGQVLVKEPDRTRWINENTYKIRYQIREIAKAVPYIGFSHYGAVDQAGNELDTLRKERYFSTNKVSSRRELEQSEAIKLYPNPLVPGSDALRISADRPLKDVRIQIYDQSGKLVHQERARQWAAGAHRLNWQPGQQSSGAFYVRLRSREHQMRWQLVVPGPNSSLTR